MEHKQLTFEQRCIIEQMLKDKHSKNSIISILELVESTFYRELKRNSKKLFYNAKHVQMLVEDPQKRVITRLYSPPKWK
jgi:IS30 family transposase